MTLDQALDIVVARTGIDRYRYLCRDHPVASVRDGYAALVMKLAGEPDSGRITIADALTIRRVNACLYRSKGNDECGCFRCALKGGQKVTSADCYGCVQRYPE